MAEMTMTYKPTINGADIEIVTRSIIETLKSFGRDKGIYPDTQDDYSRCKLYNNFFNNPIASIEISDENVRISNLKGTKRVINKAKSKLLNLVGGLKLN